MTVQTYTLTGSFESPDLTPGVGWIDLTPDQTVTDGVSDVVVAGVRIRVPLTAGDFTVTLPSGIGYHGRPVLYDGYPPEADFTVPLGTSTLDWADITNAALNPLDPTGIQQAATYTDQQVAAEATARTTGDSLRLLTSLPEIHVDSYTGTDRARLVSALAAATALGGGVVLPDRVIDVGNGLSLSGYSCSIRGRVAGGGSTHALRSGIYASTQTGPVLDFTGFTSGSAYRTTYEFSNFTVEGSGLADPTKVNVGIFEPYQMLPGAAVWRNIVIRGTGGPCFAGSGIYFQRFDNVKLIAPVGAKTNDVPYFYGQNVSGCDLDLLVYSAASSADVGVSGAVVVTDNGTFASNQNNINVRSENLHIPTGGTIVAVAGNDNVVNHRQFDCLQEVGATNTSFTRLDVPAAQNNGGNQVIGVIQGDNGSTPIVTRGVLVNQSNNRIVGVKGFKGNNVELASGVGFTYVALQGRHSGATTAAFIDNSGQTTNTLLDFNVYPGTGVPAAGALTYGTIAARPTAAVAGDRSIYMATDVNGGTEYQVQSGAWVQAAGSVTPIGGAIAVFGAGTPLTNTTTDTVLWTAPTIAAGALVAGTTQLSIRLGGKGDYAAGSGTFSVRVKVNGTNIGTFSIAASQTAGTTGKGWFVNADLFVDLIGSGGQMSLIGRTDTLVAAGTSWSAAPLNTDSAAVSLAAGLTVTVTGVMSVASPSNVLYPLRGVVVRTA